MGVYRPPNLSQRCTIGSTNLDTIADILALADQYERELPPIPTPPQLPKGKEIAGFIDHTLLKPEATAEQVKVICQEALQHQFASVCINPAYVPLVAGLLSGSPVATCTTVGFPLGASLPSLKAFETLSCIEHGATEIDMVMNVGALKGQAYGMVLNDVQAVVQVAHNQRHLVKVILETCLLTRKEKIIACLLCQASGADYVKTSTGFNTAGATVEDVNLMYRVVGTTTKVKAAGGIRDLQAALAMIQAGASRIGTSASLAIIKEASG